MTKLDYIKAWMAGLGFEPGTCRMVITDESTELLWPLNNLYVSALCLIFPSSKCGDIEETAR